MNTSNPSSASPSLQTAFLALLPRIETHARIYFREERCPQKKADCVAETVALAWRWFLRLEERGKDVNEFPMVFIFRVAQAVRSGRRATGMEPAKDVLSTVAQRKHGFTVESLPHSSRTSHEMLSSSPHGQRMRDLLEERLHDNTQTPVPDQAAFRIDFPAWLATLTGRERHFIHDMAKNERTTDLSRRFEVSPGRISQLRREFEEGWKQFQYCEAL